MGTVLWFKYRCSGGREAGRPYHNTEYQYSEKKFTEAITTDGIVWGDSETYSYKFVIQMDKDTYTAGKSVNAKVVLVNPGFSMYCPFTSGNITWSSDKKSVATVDKMERLHLWAVVK